MKFNLIAGIFLLTLLACGAKGGSSSQSAKEDPHTESVKACSTIIRRDDPLPVIARKAFRLQSECGITSETELIRRLKKFAN